VWKIVLLIFAILLIVVGGILIAHSR
jgi:hypothetical protein